jgi:ribosomal protein L22
MYGTEIKGNVAKACGYNMRVSTKNSKPVCKALRGMELHKAKRFLEDLISTKASIRGKYYTNISTELLMLIKSAEKNAEFKNFDLNNTFVAHVASFKGSTMRRRRHKNKIGNQLKATHLEVILKERPLPGGAEKPAAALKKEIEKKIETKTEKPIEHKEKAREEMKEAIKETVKAEIKKKQEAKTTVHIPKAEAKPEKTPVEAPKVKIVKDTAEKTKKHE